MADMKQPDATMHGTDPLSECAWNDLATPQDVETWIDLYNLELQACIKNTDAAGCGVCFCLAQGGEIFMHTAEDAILLDVTPEAAWVAPAITAATGIGAPRSPIWMLPGDKLIPLVLGLNSLIAFTRMVTSHRYKILRR